MPAAPRPISGGRPPRTKADADSSSSPSAPSTGAPVTTTAARPSGRNRTPTPTAPERDPLPRQVRRQAGVVGYLEALRLLLLVPRRPVVLVLLPGHRFWVPGQRPGCCP